MTSRPTVSLHLQLDIQVGDKTETIVRRIEIDDRPATFTGSDPSPGSTKFVRLNSSASLGSICAWVQYTTAPLAVRALAFPGSSIGTQPDMPPDAAVPGTSCFGGTVWQWSDANMVPNVDHSAGGRPNVFSVWYQDTNNVWHWDPTTVGFTGQDALYGSCPPLPFSGILSSTRQPAIFLGEATGFEGDSRIFNTLIALQQVGASTWNNRGDGKCNPEITLDLDGDRHTWKLTLRYQGIFIEVVAGACAATALPLIFKDARHPSARIRIAPHL